MTYDREDVATVAFPFLEGTDSQIARRLGVITARDRTAVLALLRRFSP